jgi:HD superfamily phosphodiesterase
MATNVISRVRIPDSALARAITQFVRDIESDVLFQHSTRVYLWARLSGRRRELTFDPELLYAAAMFHDLGLTRLYRHSRQRFEVDGADAARSFLRSHGIAQEDVDRVWLAVALHTTPGIPEHLHPEIALVQSGAGMDVVGRGFDDFTQEERIAVTTAYPRGSHFEEAMIDAFYQGLKHRPESTFGTFNDDILACLDPAFRRTDLCSLILDSPWAH